MTQRICPPLSHFHVTYEQVGSFKRPVRTLIVDEPEQALELFIPTLPDGWRGGVLVFDDTNCHEDEMPLLHVIIN